ncbi:MAG: hypothetical protein WCG44_00675 [bacterium]
MGILRLEGIADYDITSSAYVFQATNESPHVIGLKDPELRRLMGELGKIQGLISIATIVGDSIQVKYREIKGPDKTLAEDVVLRLSLLSVAPYLQLMDIGLVNKMARQWEHNKGNHPIAGQ